VLKRQSNTAKLREVKTWVREVLRLPEETAVMVTELQCLEPGCPPLETVIAVLYGPAHNAQYRIAASIDSLLWPQVAATLLGQAEPCANAHSVLEKK
jgi:hypothetical protein